MPKVGGHYTEKEIRKKFRLSRGRMRQLRVGWEDKKDDKTYWIEPVLIQGIDWDYYPDNGRLYYTTSTLDKLTSDERQKRSDAHTGG